MSKSTRWVFTLNNYTAEEALALETLFDYKYMIYGKEIAPTTGTPHLQGYVVFAGQKRLSAVTKLLPNAHWEIANGTTDENYAYCTKGNEFSEFGTKPKNPKEVGQETKERWTAVIKACRQGTCEQEFPGEFFRYNTTVKRLYEPQLETLDEYSGLWYHGPPGTGKSKKARDDNPVLYNKSMNQWWDGYLQQDVVLLDDLSLEHHFMGYYLKIWTDHYPFRANVKNSSMMARPKVIIVTSNYAPEEIWPHDAMMVLAIRRRFKVTYFPDFFQ